MEREIIIHSEEAGERPYINGRRITVDHIVKHYLHYKWPIEEIEYGFNLRKAEIYAALSYYYDHQDEIDQCIEEDFAAAENDDAPTLDDLFEKILQSVMTPQEIAQEYDISAEAVYKSITRNRVKARQSGSAWLVLRKEVDRLWGHKRKQKTS